MSYILHIDTSGDQGFVMLAQSGHPLFEKINTDARNHASTINTMIAEVLDEAGIKMTDLSAVAVCGGPGSYTGLRIGLATAKGICYAIDKPLLMHNKLVLLALQEQETRGKAYEQYGALLPAREGEYFITLYNSSGQCDIEPKHVSETEIAEILGTSIAKTMISTVSIKSISSITEYKNVDFIEVQGISHYFWSSFTLLELNCNRIVNLASSEPFYLKQVYTHNKIKNS